jgi:excisionase family DNA binding protein
VATVTRLSGRARKPEGPWLSVSAAARALGVSPSTLRLWASEGRVPHVRTAGGHRRFDPEALRQWLARQPARSTRPPRQGSMQITVAPELAEALRDRADLVSDAVETLVEGPAEAAYRRLPPAERRGVVRAWVDALADAFQSGSLADALERSDTYGRGHGLAGSSAEVTLGGSLALERAIDRALASEPTPLSEDQRREVVAAMSQLTVRVATAWAAAVAGRGR